MRKMLQLHIQFWHLYRKRVQNHTVSLSSMQMVLYQRKRRVRQFYFCLQIFHKRWVLFCLWQMARHIQKISHALLTLPIFPLEKFSCIKICTFINHREYRSAYCLESTLRKYLKSWIWNPFWSFIACYNI